MKVLTTALFSLSLTLSYAQLIGGSVVPEGRDVTPETVFQMEGARDGWATFELAVDRNGKVTSAQLKETNLNSSIDKMQAKKHAMRITFVAGTHYPKFHSAVVKITMIKSEHPPQEIEIIID